jgi:hypothetical protein
VILLRQVQTPSLIEHRDYWDILCRFYKLSLFVMVKSWVQPVYDHCIAVLLPNSVEQRKLTKLSADFGRLAGIASLGVNVVYCD